MIIWNLILFHNIKIFEIIYMEINKNYSNNKLSAKLLHKIHKQKICAINLSVDQFMHSQYKYLKILLILNTSIVQHGKLQCVSTNV